MKILPIVLLVIISQQAYSQFFPVDTAKLIVAYDSLAANPDDYKCQKNFMDAFPRTNKEFIATYDYCNHPNYDLTMYHHANGHIIHGLGKLHLVSDSTYCDKLIWLSIGGQWDVEIPAYLQMVVRLITKNKTEAMFSRLHKMVQGQQVAFWYFYFHDRFATRNGDFDKYKETMQEKYPGVVHSMELAHPAAAGMVWY